MPGTLLAPLGKRRGVVGPSPKHIMAHHRSTSWHNNLPSPPATKPNLAPLELARTCAPSATDPAPRTARNAKCAAALARSCKASAEAEPAPSTATGSVDRSFRDARVREGRRKPDRGQFVAPEGAAGCAGGPRWPCRVCDRTRTNLRLPQCRCSAKASYGKKLLGTHDRSETALSNVEISASQLHGMFL